MKYCPKLFVISAPSGAGKTTLVKSLIKRNKNIKYSISYTTRAPRKNEKNGIDYFFVTFLLRYSPFTHIWEGHPLSYTHMEYLL